MKRNLKNSRVEKKKRVGAGGFWKVIDEKKDDSVTKQLTPLSCVAAVGEMLLKSRGFNVNQSEIIDKIGQPASLDDLADFLNEIDKGTKEIWQGLVVTEDDLIMLCNREPFGVVLREGEPLGHLVMVDGFEKKGLVNIKDPFDGTSYKMRLEEFLKHCGGEVIIKWKM